MAKAQVIQAGIRADYTPSGSDLDAGDVIVQGELVGVVTHDTPDGELGALYVDGVFKVQKANGAITAGALVYWDADGNPQDGTAYDGAATTTSSGNKLMGKAVLAAAETDTHVYLKLDQ